MKSNKTISLLKRILLMLPVVFLMGAMGMFRVSAELDSRLIPADAVEFRGHYYKVYDDLKDNKKATWEKANKYCKKRGGHLAVITTPTEDEFVSDYLSRMGYKSVFIGLKLEDGEWKWVNDEPFAYSNWGEKNPDGGEEEIYGQYYKLYSLRKWNDAMFGFDGSAYVCEWESGSLVSDAEPSDAENYIEKDKLSRQGESYYRVFNNPLPQSDAAELCRNLGGHLAYINDAKEQAFINDLIAKDGKRNMYWIGAVSNGVRWQWLDGVGVKGYTNWSSEKPNDTSGDAVCAVISFGSDKYDIGSWVSKPPEGTPEREAEYYINYGFVCEWELICKSDDGEFISHEDSEWKTKIEGSCEDGGERYKYCLRCGEITATEKLDREPHDFERKGLIGKLSVPGLSYFVCKKCGSKEYYIDWKYVWIVPTSIIVYILFVAAYSCARDDFEAKARSRGDNVLTKRISKKLLILFPIAAVLVTVLIAIFV